MEKRILSTLFAFFVRAASYAQSNTSMTLREVKVNFTLPPRVQSSLFSQTISASDFKRNAFYNVADAIRNFSGINIEDYGGIGGVKTVSVRSLGVNHTGVQFDGIQVADAQNGQIDLDKINLENVASITLYNGQSDELLQPTEAYASASMLVIKSLTPDFKSNKDYPISFGYKTGSFGLVNPTLLWQQKISKRCSLNLSTLQSDAALCWKGADSNNFQFRINYANSSRGLPGAVVYYDPCSNQHLWNKDLFLQSSYRHHFKNKLDLLINGKFAHNQLRYLDPDYLNQAGELPNNVVFINK